MKAIVLFTSFLCLTSFAQTVHVAGHEFGLFFENNMLNETNRALIANDVVRLFAPSTNSAVYDAYASPTKDGIIGSLRHLKGPAYYPKRIMPKNIKQNMAGGLDIIITKSLSDEYLSAFALLQHHQEKIGQADIFAFTLITNSFDKIPLQQLNAMLLTKANEPGTFSTQELNEFIHANAETVCCLPSILGFHLIDEGPAGNTYLWGTIPVVGQKLGIPIIYYNNRWRISWWFLEPGEQAW